MRYSWFLKVRIVRFGNSFRVIVLEDAVTVH